MGNSDRGMDMPSPASRKKKGKSQHTLLAPTALLFGGGWGLFGFAARVFFSFVLFFNVCSSNNILVYFTSKSYRVFDF